MKVDTFAHMDKPTASFFSTIYYYLISQTIISLSQILGSKSTIFNKVFQKRVLLSNNFILGMSCFLRKIVALSQHSLLNIVHFEEDTF